MWWKSQLADQTDEGMAGEGADGVGGLGSLGDRFLHINGQYRVWLEFTRRICSTQNSPVVPDCTLSKSQILPVVHMPAGSGAVVSHWLCFHSLPDPVTQWPQFHSTSIELEG